MTVTEAPPQESPTEYPLDTVIADLEDILGRLRDAAGHTDGPLALKVRAAMARRAAGELADLPGQLHQEAMQSDAEAAALRAADEAAEVLEEAAGALRDAGEAYARTGEPEQEAAGRVTNARQLAEEAADALAQAERDGAEPAILAELHGRVRDSAAVLEHESGKFAAAQSARQSAKAGLDKARDQQREAQEALAAAEAAAAEPSAASLDARQLVPIWARSWPWNLNTAALTEPELTAFRFLVTETCDENNWVPRLAESRIRVQHGHEMAATIRQGHAIEIHDGRGVLRLRADPLGMVGASQVATVAQAR